MKTQSILGMSVVAGSALLAGIVLAGGIPAAAPIMTYSGVLRTGDGQPLAEVDKILQLKLWPSALPTGMELCSTPPTAITTDKLGHFSIALDQCVDAVKANSDVHVEVIVGTLSLGTAKLGAVPYAVEAAHATSSDSSTAASSIAAGAFRVSNDCKYAGSSTDCTCESGELAISGGGCASENCVPNTWLAESARVSWDSKIWRVSCADASGKRVRCASEFVLCVRVSE